MPSFPLVDFRTATDQRQQSTLPHSSSPDLSSSTNFNVTFHSSTPSRHLGRDPLKSTSFRNGPQLIRLKTLTAVTDATIRRPAFTHSHWMINDTYFASTVSPRVVSSRHRYSRYCTDPPLTRSSHVMSQRGETKRGKAKQQRRNNDPREATQNT